MAEGIIIDFVNRVLGKLCSAFGDEIGLLRSFKGDVEYLKNQLVKIQAVLLDAEDRNIVEENDDLRMRLSKLKGAVCDIEDLLVEFRTEAVPQQQPHEVQNQNQLAKMVCGFLSCFEFLSCLNPINLMFKFEMAHRMKELREKIGNIDIDKIEADLSRQAEMKSRRDDSGTSSSVNKQKDKHLPVKKQEIVGRDDDKEEIVKLLLETNGDHDLSVIPIVGMGGLGKTTLARLAFNDGRVMARQAFDLLVWVYVSTDFDTEKIKKAVKSAAEEKFANDENTDAVRIFKAKKILLVLDDVWNENWHQWKDFKDLFEDGKKGSKILVTTRNKEIANKMKTVKQPLHLKGLSDDDCWTLFKREAFIGGEENYYPDLVAIGKQMVKNCGGVPFAVQALGSMMSHKIKTKARWSDIRDKQIWMLEKTKEMKEEDKILPSLKLSYIHMRLSALKKCFTYCYIFPKGYEIDKDDLIQQWIALGFISCSDKNTLMEDIGNEYFNELLSRYFLQEVEDSKEYNGKVTYRMHDLMHDLAQSIARDEFAVQVGEDSTEIPEHCCHASIYSYFVSQVPTTVVRRLRALQYRESASQITESASLTTFLSKAKRLRLLKLHCDIDYIDSTLPISIGELKLLRYLNLSETDIEVLPKSVTGLCNLQTLNLSGCYTNDTLPDSVFHLKNLRYLDLSNLESLTTLSESIGSLQNLRILNLSNCHSLRSLPSTLCDLKNLHYLDLSLLTSLKELPESIWKLENLHILNLSECSSLLSLPSLSSDPPHLEKLDISHCKKLCELPKMIQRLTILRELLNEDCQELKGMPRGIGKLVSLQKLPIFVVGKQDSVKDCASISELEHLNLDGELEIKGLKNVTNPVDAKAANLIEKKLWSLTLKWNVLSAAVDMDTVQPAEKIDTVLENLQPHQNLENLVIEGYTGSKFPRWMMNTIGSCLPNLVKIKLANMPRCRSLPLLGLLPVLKDITIQDMPEVANLGVEFYGDSHIACANKFPALTRLSLICMPVLEEWATVLPVDDKEGRPQRVPIFPCLTQLTIDNCPHLRPEPCLPPSVEELTILNTSKETLSEILKPATTGSERPHDDGGDALSLQLPNQGLRELVIIGGQHTCLPERLRSLTSLQRLGFSHCFDLERIEDWLGELTKLQSLRIALCHNLHYLPAHKMTTLKELYIYGSPLLFNAAGQFVDTSVNHIADVQVDFNEYQNKKQIRRSPQEEKSSPEGEVSSPKEEELKEMPEEIELVG